MLSLVSGKQILDKVDYLLRCNVVDAMQEEQTILVSSSYILASLTVTIWHLFLSDSANGKQILCNSAPISYNFYTINFEMIS